MRKDVNALKSLVERFAALPHACFHHKIPDLLPPFAGSVLWMYPQTLTGERGARASKLHAHTFFEIHFSLRGSMEFADEKGCRYSVAEHTCICFLPSVLHCLTHCTPDVYRLSFTFSLSDMQSEYGNCKRADQILLGSGEWVLDFLAQVLGAWEHYTPLSPYLLQNAVVRVLLQLPIGQLNMPVEDEGMDTRLQRMKRYIKDHAARDVKVTEVADMAYMSVRQVERLFLDAGERVSDVIDRERLQAAKALLSQREYTVAQVAERLYFSNEYNFIRFFKRIEGITPGKYRASLME